MENKSIFVILIECNDCKEDKKNLVTEYLSIYGLFG